MYNDNSQRQNIMQKATVSSSDYPEGQGVPAPLVGSYIYSTFKDRNNKNKLKKTSLIIGMHVNVRENRRTKSRMDNPEKFAAFDTQDTERRTTNKTK